MGDVDGHGRFGAVDEDDEGLLCHECGGRYRHLGLHAWKAHGLTADTYRLAHGLGRRGLVATTTRKTIVENARRNLIGRTAFVKARDPALASAAQRTGADAISPAGLAAIREAGRARRSTRRLGTVITCEWCGVEFCPLLGAARRRFCTRSCAGRNARGVPPATRDAGR